MNNKQSKKQLAQLLCTHDLGNDIGLVSRGDSISYVLHAVSRGAQTVCILRDDTDVFLLLVHWCHRANVTCPILMEMWDGTVLDINDTVSRLGSTCTGILGMDALSGSDTVSYLKGKGEFSALKVENQNNGLDSVLGEMNASEGDLMATLPAFTWYSTPRRRAIQLMLQAMTFF